MAAGGGKNGGPQIDRRLIRDLAKLMEETGLTEIELDAGGVRMRVARAAVAAQPSVPAAPPASAQGAASEVKPASAAESGPTAGAGPPAGAVTSPMVGTAYLAPEPGAPVFVKVGDTVAQGQVLLIVEAMKTMNHIPAPHGGTVRQIAIEDGQPIEYGDVLMVIA